MVGKSLSHYLIEVELGRGGMGIVYRARDTKLDRTVAIKVLPSAALASEDDRARFYREAKAAAQLHHPHIASVFEIDEAVPEGSKDDDLRPFIAMEFIEGETLHDKIQNGPLKLEEAVRIAGEIASALEAAHEKSIVHRDIKAANVMLTSKGVAKVLDFGLAQTSASTKLTRMGSTLGTVAYMSPEQARGEPVDGRTDIWSLGAVLYEMISGRPAFPGEYDKAVIYSLLNEEPEPLTSIRTGVPMGVEWIVSKCLAKKADARYQNATDLLVDLHHVDLTTAGMSRVSSAERSFHTSSITPGVPSQITPRKPGLSIGKKAGSALLLAALAIFAGGYFLSDFSNSRERPLQSFKHNLRIDGYTNLRNIALSPTLEYVAFTGNDSLSQESLLLLKNETSEIIPISKSEGARKIRFSPDGRWLAFAAYGATYVVEVPAAEPFLIAERSPPLVWENENVLLLVKRQPFNFVERYNMNTRTSTPVGPAGGVDTTRFDRFFQIYSVIPGSHLGLGFLFEEGQESSSYLVADLQNGNYRTPRTGISALRYVPGGYVAYISQGWAGKFSYEPIDLTTGELLGGPKPVLDCMEENRFDVGLDGTLVYVPNESSECRSSNQLFLLDLQTLVTEPVHGLPTNELNRDKPHFSPGGDAVAYHVDPAGSRENYIMVIDLNTGLPVRVTFSNSWVNPVWSPDGAFLYFAGAVGSNNSGIFRQPIGSPGQEKRVISGRASNPAISNNSRLLAFAMNTDIYLHDLAADTSWVFDDSDGEQWDPVFSPDDRYLAFGTQRSEAKEFEVRSIDGNFRRRSPVPGWFPVWSRDRNYIYFIENGGFVSRIKISLTPSFDFIGRPERLAWVRGTLPYLDISPDGKTLVVAADEMGTDLSAVKNLSSTIVWWQNWAATLSKE